ncbi:MAG: hypothetical protein F6K54_33930 [Okeania sp. SIO3B5]|uniref:hypothetical protein n=1 Tax=Okeania sp. SIO3B5 TaxID=2607811 RepID=UPI001401665B|nr:hypothetical protein [Okeania sp. SIO3B5]NEO57632.1 hypothetical protein [Okeania sp. SIO3B5]
MTPTSLNTGVNEKKRSEWLQEVSAHLVESYEVTESGKNPIKRVFFEEQEAPLSILSHVWDEYDTYAEATLHWLYELAEGQNFEVRLKVAETVGQLATYEFLPVLRKILSPWAKSGKPSVQRLAALALAVVAYNEQEHIAQQALNLVDHWSNLKTSSSLQWTAIAAYGGYIGLLVPEKALDNLKIIAQSGNGKLFSDIAKAVEKLFNAGVQIPKLHGLVLNTLREWVDQGENTSVYRLSLLIFRGLMRKSWIVKNDIRQPTLLWLAKESKDFEDPIVYLMRNGLNLGSRRDSILAEILNWLEFVDRHPTLYKTLARIIFTLAASSGNERKRMCYYLKIWSINSQTAIQILNLINKHL